MKLRLNTMNIRLLFILMGMAIFSTAMVISVFSIYEVTTAKQEQEQSIKTMANILAPNITAALIFDDRETINELLQSLLQREDIVNIHLLSPENVTIINSAKPGRTQPETIKITTPLQLEGHRYGQLIIQADNSIINKHIFMYSQFLILVVCITFFLCLLLSLLLKKSFLRPLLHLSTIAQSITSSNNYSLRARSSSIEEMANLANCFNNMLDTIEKRDNRLEIQVSKRNQELEKANRQLHDFAYKDGLTGLPNRRYFHNKISQLVTENTPFTLFFIDLDQFKEINDTLGHEHGDILLKKAGQRLKNCISHVDTIARLGGDEFTIILERIDKHDIVKDIAERVLMSLSRQFTIEQESSYISGSIGITLFPHNSVSVEELLQHADLAMYEAKRKGRDQYQFFTTELQTAAKNKRTLAEELRAALKGGQFELYLQPIAHLNPIGATWVIMKAEALIRWNHPHRGLIYPGDFIPIAEETGLIKDITHWVMMEVVAISARWYHRGIRNVQISINTPPEQFNENNQWICDWLSAIDSHKVPAHNFMIEITENALMESGAAIIEQLAQLHARGIEIAIDDFGVGHSSLAYLQQLDIDFLKIDRSFIRDLASNKDSMTLVKTITTMAHQLGLKVVTEGVETEQQYDKIVSAGCDYIQGYLISKPLRAEHFYNTYLLKPEELISL